MTSSCCVQSMVEVVVVVELKTVAISKHWRVRERHTQIESKFAMKTSVERDRKLSGRIYSQSQKFSRYGRCEQGLFAENILSVRNSENPPKIIVSILLLLFLSLCSQTLIWSMPLWLTGQLSLKSATEWSLSSRITLFIQHRVRQR